MGCYLHRVVSHLNGFVDALHDLVELGTFDNKKRE